MRKLIISAALLSAFAVSAPATAQRWENNQGYGQNQTRGFEQQLQQLGQRIDNMYQRGLLSSKEGRKLQQRVLETRHRLHDYARNGLTYRERDNIQERIQDLRQRIQSERQEGRDQRRDDRRDRW